MLLSVVQGEMVSLDRVNVHGSFPALVVGLRQVRLPMTGTAVGGVRLTGPQRRGGEGRGGEKGRGRGRGGGVVGVKWEVEKFRRITIIFIATPSSVWQIFYLHRIVKTIVL